MPGMGDGPGAGLRDTALHKQRLSGGRTGAPRRRPAVGPVAVLVPAERPGAGRGRHDPVDDGVRAAAAPAVLVRAVESAVVVIVEPVVTHELRARPIGRAGGVLTVDEAVVVFVATVGAGGLHAPRAWTGGVACVDQAVAVVVRPVLAVELPGDVVRRIVRVVQRAGLDAVRDAAAVGVGVGRIGREQQLVVQAQAISIGVHRPVLRRIHDVVGRRVAIGRARDPHEVDRLTGRNPQPVGGRPHARKRFAERHLHGVEQRHTRRDVTRAACLTVQRRPHLQRRFVAHLHHRRRDPHGRACVGRAHIGRHRRRRRLRLWCASRPQHRPNRELHRQTPRPIVAGRGINRKGWPSA